MRKNIRWWVPVAVIVVLLGTAAVCASWFDGHGGKRQARSCNAPCWKA